VPLPLGEADLGAILDHVGDGITVQDAAGRLVYANAAAARALGFASAADLLAPPPGAVLARYEVLDEDGAPLPPARLPGRRALAGEAEPAATVRFRPRCGGEERWAQVRASPIRDAAGAVRLAVTVWRDVTDRRRAEERDRALAAIVTTSDDAIITKTLDGTITSWNPAAERLYGWAAAEVVGRPISVIVPPDKREELADILARLGRGERIDHHETARVTKDGRRLDVAVSISPLVDAAGRVVGASKIGRDVTDRRRAEQLREEFLATVSHDLKNPLGGVKATAQLLLRRLRRGEPPDPARLERGLAAIDQAASRMVGLIDDLVDAARLRAGEALDLRPEPVDLVALARRCVEQYAATTQEHALRVVAEVPELVGTWDGARLERVVANLLTNAIKYSPGGGAVVVRVAREADAAGSWAVLSVRDRGLGIPAADLPRVFDRFRRGTNVGGIGGAGLGLAGAARIVEQHGGAVGVESAEGRGTTVTVRLPLGAQGGLERADDPPGASPDRDAPPAQAPAPRRSTPRRTTGRPRRRDSSG
jgi:PAS domain S-box-containing protein